MNHPIVLIAINDLFFMSKIKTALEAQGCLVLVATQPKQILKVAQDQNPTMIIFDLGMSTIDTAGLIEEIRRVPKLKDLPVLCYTNHVQVPTWEASLKDGRTKVVANSYISSNINSIVGLISLFDDTHSPQVGL
jgi:CheY-like chemotaxis protein